MKQGWLIAVAWTLTISFASSEFPASAEEPKATKEFEIRGDRPFLGGRPVDLWGLRCGNGLYSTAVTERLINALDTMTAHGINLVGVYIQGPNAGWPNPEAGFDGFRRDGRLKPEQAGRLEWLIREADARGMVVQVGLISPRKDQTFYDEDCIRRAIQETGKFLVDRKLKNVFVDLVHEYDHPERIDHEILREPDAAAKKARLTKWFKEAAPDVEAGVCQNFPAESTDVYPGQEVRIIEKGAAIPGEGFVVNVEITRQDVFENDGVFLPAAVDKILATCQEYLDAPHAVMMFHSAYSQGVTNKSGTAPHPEPGGYGTNPNDRGIRFYFEWVREHVGRYEYPNHVKDTASAGRPAPFTPQDAPTGGKRP